MKDFSEIKVIDPYVENGMWPKLRFTLATGEDVEIVEKALGINFPVGYADYVTTLGKGEYCSFIRINMPFEIVEQAGRHRVYIHQYYYFWEMGSHILSKDDALHSYQIGSTDVGDIIVLVPTKSNDIYVLPRHDDMLYRIGHDLFEAIDWLCMSHRSKTGSVGESHENRFFVPYNPLQFDHGVLSPENA